MTVKELCTLIEENQNALFELLGDLIRINSENFGTSGNEQPLAEYIHGLCRSLGLESELYSPMELENFEEHPDYWPGHHLENRPNVTARWHGKQDRDALMLMGHTDTVPIGDVSAWDDDPLWGGIRDGKIYGRGACDDKYALAAALFVIRLLKDSGFVPRKNMLFTAYSDEENGGSHGALAAALKYPCDCIVNMDGRNGQIWNCASGGQVLTYRYHGLETADSAEATAAVLPVVMEKLREFAKRREEELTANRFYAGTGIPTHSFRYQQIGAGINGAAMNAGALTFTFYTVKHKAEIDAELTALETELNSSLAPLGFVGDGFVRDTRFFHYGFCEPDDSNILDMVAAGKEATGRDILVCGSCLSDLSVLLKFGAGTAFAFGGGRDFSQDGGPHQPNEFITCEEFMAFTKTIGAYILRTLG